MATRDIRLYTPGNNDLTSLSAARELAPFLHLSVPEGAPKRAKIPDRLFKLLELDEDNDNDTQLKDLISLGISTAPAYDAFSFAHNAGGFIMRHAARNAKEYERTAMPRGEFEAYLSKCVAQGIDYGIKMPYGELNAMIEGNKRKKSVLRNLTRQIPLLRNIIRDVYVIPSVNPEFEAKATEWLLAQINSRTGKGDFECLEQVVMNVGRDNVEWQCNPRYDAAVTGGMEFSWSEYYGSGLRAD